MSPRASGITLDRDNSMLFKGSPGFSKTISACTFALEGPVYLAYFDKKKPYELATFFTEKRFGSKAKRILDNIEYDIYGSHNANEYINKVIKMAQDCRYFAFITDSVTNLTSAAVNWSLGFRTGGKKDKEAKDKDTPQMIPDFDEYKVETSLVSQVLDICKTLPCHIIWTAHPLPSLKVEGSGRSMTVTKGNSIVTYGSKVAGMIPGNFTEIYHFSQRSDWNQQAGSSSMKYMVATQAIGEEFAKSPLLSDYVKEFDITDKLFYEVWKDLVNKAGEARKMSPEDIAKAVEDVTSQSGATESNTVKIPTQWKV